MYDKGALLELIMPRQIIKLIVMNNIRINFNKELVSDMKIFELFMNDLQNL